MLYRLSFSELKMLLWILNITRTEEYLIIVDQIIAFEWNLFDIVFKISQFIKFLLKLTFYLNENRLDKQTYCNNVFDQDIKTSFDFKLIHEIFNSTGFLHLKLL